MSKLFITLSVGRPNTTVRMRRSFQVEWTLFRLKFSIYKFLDIFELKSWHIVALIHIIKYHEYNSMRESLRGGRVGLPLPFPGKIKGLFFF